MRRRDAIAIAVGVFVAGGLAYLILQGLGLDGISAGIWSQVLLVGALIGWAISYVARVFRQEMTLNVQLRDYREAVLQKRLEEMSPEELARLQGEAEESGSPPERPQPKA